ncbi:hypothetical protein JCM16816_19490 [Thermoanaerobacter brockii subsp. lactiethylicus]
MMLKRWTDKLKRHNKRVCITKIIPEVSLIRVVMPSCSIVEEVAQITSVKLKRDLLLLSLSETKDHLNKKERFNYEIVLPG